MKHGFYAKIYLVLLVALLAKLSLTPLFADRTFGSKDNPIRIALVPSQEAGKVLTNAEKLMERLHEKTGYYFTAYMPANYIVAIEGFGTSKVDIAMVTTFSYLLANQKYGATAALKIVRRNGDTCYGGQFLALKGSNIRSIQDLHGKRVAFTDPASGSGYVLPKAMLKKLGVVPSQEVFAQRHDNVVMMIYQRQVDAGAAYYSAPDQRTGELQDARALVKKQYPDVAEKVVNIGYTEKIANDPISFRQNFPPDMKANIVKALVEYASSPEGKPIMINLYGIEGLIPAKDTDYDALRAMLKEQGMDIEELVKKTKK
jgi:phosphonate transport system substrate-binding protein